MSIKIMSLIWDAELPDNQKLVMLAYADHADDDGKNIFPAIGRISWKTGYSERQVQRITKQLVDLGYMALEGKSRLRTNLLKIDLPMLPKRAPYQPKETGRPEKDGDKMSPTLEKDGDIPEKDGDILAKDGDIAMSPNPSFNHPIESSNNAGNKLPGRQRDPLLDNPAIQEYRDIAKLNIPAVLRQEVCDTVTNIDTWKAIIYDWIGHGWNKQNISGMLAVYRNGGLAGRNGSGKNTDPNPTTIIHAPAKRNGENGLYV